MKKLFVCALAVGMFTACSQDETISQQSPMQISFDGAFVENATRAIDPSFHDSKKPLEAFDVWAFMDNKDGSVFTDEDVKKENGAWKTTSVQYWAPNHNYYFAALAPMNSENIVHENFVAGTEADGHDWAIGTVNFTNIDGTEDLLYATATATTGATITENDPGKVSLVFNHLLAKVKFSFTNEFPNDNASIKITNIKMTAPAKAAINLNQPFENLKATNHWALQNQEETVALAFGDMETEKVASGDDTESQFERLTIPTATTQSYVVTFDVELFYGTVSAYKNSLKTTISGVALEMGKAYNFHAKINSDNIVPGDDEDGNKLFPIEFEARVEDWVDGGIQEGGVINTESLPILDLTVAAGESKTISASSVIPTTLSVAGSLNGQGNTVYAAAEPTDNGLVRPTGEATIKNLTINGKNKSTAAGKGIRGIFIEAAGTYTIDNVTVEDVTYAINVNTTEEVTLNVTNSTLEGWTSYGSSTTANFTNVKFTTNPDAYGMLRPQGETYFKNCSFDKDFRFSLDLLKEGITFEGCTWDGVAITSANIAAMISTDYYDGVAADANLNKITYK